MSAKRTDNKGRVLRTGESQRKDLSYMFRYTDKWGNRVTVYAPTLQALREKEKQIVVDEARGVKAVNKTKLKELTERVCRLQETKRLSTQKGARSYHALVCRYPIAEKQVRDIKISETKLWLLQLLEEGYAPSTIRAIGAFCKRACQMGVEDDILAKNPFGYEFTFLPSNGKREGLTPDEQKKLLGLLEQLKTDDILSFYSDYLIILMETGLRLGELRGLTQKDVDIKKGTVLVKHQLRGDGPADWKITEPKSAAGVRVIPLSDAGSEAFKRVIARAKKIRVSIEIDGYKNFIILGPNGSPINNQVFLSAFQRICRRYAQEYGLQLKMTPHVLRHTFCSNLYRRGLSNLSLQYVMGHASLSTTLDTYTHCDADSAIEEMHRLLSA